MKRRMKDRMGNVGGPGLLVFGEHCIQIVPITPRPQAVSADSIKHSRGRNCCRIDS